MKMKTDLFFNLKYQSSTIMLSVGIKSSVHDLFFDGINYAWTAN